MGSSLIDFKKKGVTLPVVDPNEVQSLLNIKHGEYWKPYCKKINEGIKKLKNRDALKTMTLHDLHRFKSHALMT